MINRSKYITAFRDNIRIIGAFILITLFLIISMISVKNGGTLLWFIPPVLLLALLGFIAVDKFLLLIVFLVPMSVQLRFIIPEPAADIFLPTELLLAGLLILMCFKVFIFKEIDKKILVHPVSVISFCLLAWYLISSLTSTIPAVSIKSFLARLWFFAGFYLLTAEIFRKPERIRVYFSLYILGMIPVVAYYLFRMCQTGIFNQKAAYQAVRPFFNDHTSFGAALAFCIPLILYFLTAKEATRKKKIVLSILLFFFSAAFIFSYSRAAWLSLITAALLILFLILRISWKIILPGLVIAIVVIATSWSGLMIRLNENRQESSGKIMNHLRSVYNIRSDASNMERVNRWKSALRMFREKPITGWGPATYQFKYAPFQMASEKTIISTNYGEGGNAHSEYLGSLAEEGIPGLIFYLSLLFISIRKGIIIWKTHPDNQIRYMVLALIAGLVTYVVHGAMNNFLDTDKISALFWGMIAAIVSIDIRQNEENSPGKLSQVSSDD
jgi:putative inorganic carbon (HCO3(-)) transporter